MDEFSPKNISHSIARRLRDIRKEQRRTLYDVAEKADISVRQYSDIESGRTDFRIKTLAKLCEGLGVDLMYVLDGISKSRTVF